MRRRRRWTSQNMKRISAVIDVNWYNILGSDQRCSDIKHPCSSRRYPLKNEPEYHACLVAILMLWPCVLCTVAMSARAREERSAARLYASQSAGGGLGVQIAAGDSRPRPDIITASGGGRRSTVGGAQRVHGELATPVASSSTHFMVF